MLTTTSSNHVEILRPHETNYETIWLRSLINYIQVHCGLQPLTNPTELFDDKVVWVQ